MKMGPRTPIQRQRLGSRGAESKQTATDPQAKSISRTDTAPARLWLAVTRYYKAFSKPGRKRCDRKHLGLPNYSKLIFSAAIDEKK